MRGQIYCVSSMKGGVGKTEVALNFAIATKKKTGKRVVVVDFDIPYGGVAQAFAIDKSVSLSDWIRTNRAISEEAMKSILIQHPSGLDILPAIASVFDLEKFTGDIAKRVIQTLANVYDYVIVDTGVDFGSTTQAALILANKVIVITTPSTVSVWNNHAYKSDLLRIGLRPENILLFINQVPYSKRATQEIMQVKQAYEQSGVAIQTVSYAFLDDKIRESRNKRDFIYLKDRRNQFSVAIDDVLEKLGVANLPLQSVASNGSFGVLSFLKKVVGR